MKKIFRNIFMLSAFVAITSCNDAIDVFQPAIIEEADVFSNVDDLQRGLRGVYIQMDHTQDIFFNANYTDEVTRGLTNGGQGLNGFNFIMAGNLQESNVFWQKYYSVNMRAQRVLEKLNAITPPAADQAAYNSIKGQLIAISAYSHFMLFAYYTPDYTNNAGLSVPLINFVPSVELRPMRNTVAEVAGYINSALIEAEGLISQQSNPVFMSKDFCRALRARLAAYRQDYATAGPLAQGLMASYPLANPTQYTSMFRDDVNNTEVIFKLARTVGDRYDRQAGDGGNGTVLAGGRAGNVFAFTNQGIAGGPFMEVNRSLFNLLNENPDDVRRIINVHPTSVINPVWTDDPNQVGLDNIVINKYPGKDGQPLLQDLKLFRGSEMHLIAIEALIHDNQLGQAATLMQQLRNARLTVGVAALPVYASQEAAYFDLLNERRREFCFEGHRYLDLKRLGQRANQGISRASSECSAWGWSTCTAPATDYRFTLPIPNAEINGNPGIAAQQNPGY